MLFSLSHSRLCQADLYLANLCYVVWLLTPPPSSSFIPLPSLPRIHSLLSIRPILSFPAYLRHLRDRFTTLESFSFSGSTWPTFSNTLNAFLILMAICPPSASIHPQHLTANLTWDHQVAVLFASKQISTLHIAHIALCSGLCWRWSMIRHVKQDLL